MSTRKRKYPETYRTNIERIFIVSEIIKRKYEYCSDINERMWLIENWNLPIKKYAKCNNIFLQDEIISSFILKYCASEINMNYNSYLLEQYKFLYEIIINEFSEWIIHMSNISKENHIYANKLIHLLDMEDFINVYINDKDKIRYMNIFLLDFIKKPEYLCVKFLDTIHFDIDIRCREYNFEEMHNWINLYIILYKSVNGVDISKEDVDFIIDRYSNIGKFTPKGINRKLIGLLIWDLENGGKLKRNNKNNFIFNDINPYLKSLGVFSWINKDETKVNDVDVFLRLCHNEIRNEVCSNDLYCKNINKLTRYKFSEFSYSYLESKMLALEIRKNI